MQKNISVLSLNLFGTPFHPHRIIRSFFRNGVRKRFRVISEVINEKKVDILLFQEIHDYPHLIYLKKLLPDYPYTAYKPMLYAPRGGLVIFSKFPLEKVHFYDFIDKGKIHDKSITGYLQLKGILQAKIKGENVWLANTHLTQNSDHNWNQENRFVPILRSQLKQVSVHINALRERRERVILGGDFNMPKSTSYYKDFLEMSGIKDIFGKDSFDTYQASFLPQGAIVGRVDYIFASKDIPVVNTSYILKDMITDREGNHFYASDHIGLIANLSLMV
jgi:exonuclease III